MAVLFTEINQRELAWRDELLDRYRALLQKLELEEGVVSDFYLVYSNQQPRAFAAPDVVARINRLSASDLNKVSMLVRQYFDYLQDTDLRDPALREIADTVIGRHDVVRRVMVGAAPDDELVVLFDSQVNAGRPVGNGNLTAREGLLARVVGRLRDQRQLEGERTPTRLEIRAAQGWVEDQARLFDVALEPIRKTVLRRNNIDYVNEAHWANAVGRMAKDGITADDGYIRRVVDQSMMPFLGLSAAGSDGGSSNGSIGGLGGVRPSWIDIKLPDLEAEADLDIVEANLMAMQAIYFASTLEDLRFFQVMDKILEQFNVGVLPLGKGSAGDKIYAYWKRNFDRFTEVERHNLYARALGKPGGDVGMGTPNRQFNDLWLRFISSVSEWRRQVAVDSLLRDGTPYGVSIQRVRKSARDLAANLSLFGYGIAYFAATELQQQVRDVLAILSDEELRSAYGARDVWQVIDQVATLELGGARNSVRYRTMANSGAVIIRWLANNSHKLAATSVFDSLLQPSDLNGAAARRNPLENPTNFDLIEACEQYLAVTGTPGARVEEYSQPALGPDLTTRPIQIPGVARDVFESVGISPGDYGLN